MDRFIGQRYRAILSYSGLVVGTIGLLFFLPATFSRSEYEALAFLLPGSALLFIALLSWRLLPRSHEAMTVQDAAVVIVMSWLSVCLVSAIPFMSLCHLNFTQAIFEAVSGWTTTGLSVVNVDTAPPAILLWRSVMQGAGGAGFAILMLGFLAAPLGTAISTAEGRAEQLVPHVKQSAKLVAIIYSSYIIIGIVAYAATGMTWFDALNHSLCAVSTGGFSTKTASIGYWNSLPIEAVTLPLMILGNLSFLTAWLILQGNFRIVRKDPEIRLFSLLMPLAASLLFFGLCRSLYPHLAQAIRVSIFEVTSALTTTGYSITTYSNWNHIGLLILMVLMVVGGGTYSTAGGIKQARIYLLFRLMIWEIRRALYSRTAVIRHFIWSSQGKDFLTDQRLAQVGAFTFLYFLFLTVGTTIMVAHGIPFEKALFEYASSLGTVGLSVGVTSPDLPPIILWSQSMGMLLGRLEFLVVFRGVLIFCEDIRKASRAVVKSS